LSQVQGLPSTQEQGGRANLKVTGPPLHPPDQVSLEDNHDEGAADSSQVQFASGDGIAFQSGVERVVMSEGSYGSQRHAGLPFGPSVAWTSDKTLGSPAP